MTIHPPKTQTFTCHGCGKERPVGRMTRIEGDYCYADCCVEDDQYPVDADALAFDRMED